QDLVGLLQLLAADEVEHLARLVRGHADVAHLRARAGTLVGLEPERHALPPPSHGLLLAGVVLERARRGELTELVTDHRLGHVHGHVLATVVDGDGVADHVGDDRGAAAPRLDDLLLAPAVEVVDLLQQVVVDERPLLQAARHGYLRSPRVRRRRTISFCDGLFLLRVRPSGLPHGDTGWRPPELLPSPPPSGWSTGFMATPRVCGRTPFQRLRPALPSFTRSASALPTSPTVARQSMGTRRISVDGSRNVAKSPSLATSCTLAPALRAIFPPAPGLSSTLCTTVPTGM